MIGLAELLMPKNLAGSGSRWFPLRGAELDLGLEIDFRPVHPTAF